MVHCSLRPRTGTTRGSLGVLLVALTLVPLLASCTKGKRADVDPRSAATPVAEGEERIVGVTTTDGRVIEFDDPGAHLRNDTLYARVGGDYFTMAMADADRVIVERRVGDTLATVALVAGVTLGVLLVAGAIYAATKESCPFVYAWNGESYVFDAEPYGGAIAKGLERDDYSPLEHLEPDEGVYRLRITNEVNETQRTNFMELWVVDHDTGARIAADAAGNLYDVRGRRAPTTARDAAGRDLLPWLENTDALVWEPMAVPGADGDLGQEIVITFPREPGATEARLVVNAATGLWGSHMIREFVELRGAAGGATWLAGLGKDAAELARLDEWLMREQIYLLPIYVEEPTGWEVRGLLRGEGPFIAHDRVIPLDVSRVSGNQVRIRIQPPRGFWALNSFKIDFASTPPLTPIRVAARAARTPAGADVLPLLAEVDDSYHVMPNIGDRAVVWFPVPPRVPGRERTVILHSRGYYDLHLDPSAEPNEPLVRRIQDDRGAAARYAGELYEAWDAAELRRSLERGAVAGY